MLTNIYNAHEEGNFCDDPGNTMKLINVEHCSWSMGYIGKSNRMAYSYSVSRQTIKLIFHLTDTTK